jgi:CHAT domain-containing protein
MGKLRPHLGAAERLFIAPDGALNLVPFGALVDENEAFLVQRYAMTYLTSGRDLIRLSVNAKPRTNPVVLANPDFAGSSPKATPTGATQSSSPVRGRRSAGLSMSEWSALPGTANEAEALANLLGSLTLLTGSNATENALKQVRSPSLLHIATHGFFLESRHDKENPLLRSGLILSGANKLASDDQDGVLTALEASGLSLWGTQMVVLSACQTGLGSIRSGEGVYGLRRALVIAGSESQVMSLWQVDDEATKDLMIGFYKRLQQGLGRSDALRASQLRLLENPEYAHPFFWASFIGSGHWTPLATN